MKRSKADEIDAKYWDLLRKDALEAWERQPMRTLTRAIARRIAALTKLKTQIKLSCMS